MLLGVGKVLLLLRTIRHANTLKRGNIANTLHQQRWKWIGLEPAMRSLHCSGSSSISES